MFSFSNVTHKSLIEGKCIKENGIIMDNKFIFTYVQFLKLIFRFYRLDIVYLLFF